MNRNLYRQEALDHQSYQFLGRLTVQQSLPVTIAVSLISIAAVLLVVFILWGEYTRKERVTGYLSPDKGLLKIYAPQAGILQQIHVKEGDWVEKGTPLFLLADNRGTPESANLIQEQIRNLEEQKQERQEELDKQIQINQYEARTLQLQQRGNEAELTQLETEIRYQQQRADAARAQMERLQVLLESKNIAAIDVDVRRNEYLDQTILLKSLQRERVAIENQIAVLSQRQEQTELQSANLISSIKREIFELQQTRSEIQARGGVVIPAPESGHITSMLVKAGQSISTSLPLFSILPSGAQLEAKLFIPSRAIGFVRVDQEVAIRYQAFPYQRYGSYRGRISDIGRTLTNSNDVNLPVPLAEPAYIATVILDQQAIDIQDRHIELQPGMTFEADIQLDKRNLYQWIFEPVIGLARKV